ncbi:ABC transporter ATP-binding protein [Methanobrevibacter millerae]|uniref:Polysaccharide/polyol phosphate ABC transporter ATP-binding protein n=1 Tax=Methanobrevibacter millerae TaxID=230361 RepID=A0A0U2L7A9_9EURY|nr:ABC transporter ATP-binding protein [Methanobrevibacter millerae]ALT69758.1 polysaccharide/polyol phosphate ABC transporter ATP-binding protein [Methanobrevibacter millerae]
MSSKNNKSLFKIDKNDNINEYGIGDYNPSYNMGNDVGENINSKDGINYSFDVDEKLYDEAQFIFNALKNKKLDIPEDEEIQLKQDLNLILSAGSIQKDFQNNNSKKNKLILNDDTNDLKNTLDIYENSNNISNSDDILKNFEDSSDSISHVVDFEKSLNVESEDIFQDDVLEDVNLDSSSVDDALSDLVEDYSNETVIKVDNVSMDYKLSKDKIDTLKEFFIRTIKRNREKTKTISALKNISFEIPRGDRVGIIGFNGAGKSTLLKLLSRVYDPTEGTIETKGRIAPLLELGAGFDMNYTGKANIFLNGAFLGFSEDFIKEKYDEIVEFSELGDAINYHVKTYSSGMRAKLGFSIATIVEPDILIIDEILSVGDIKFQRKSSDKIRSLINSGITVLLVSHSVSQIRELCNKAIWIDDGEIKMMGEVNKVCDAYVKAANDASQEQLKNINLD